MALSLVARSCASGRAMCQVLARNRAALLTAIHPEGALAAPQFCQTRGFAVATSQIKTLREMSGAPMMECKAALESDESKGDLTKALAYLRKRGAMAAEGKRGRVAAQGLVAVKHDAEGGEVAALVEMNSETDFVSRNAVFQDVASRIASSALHALTARPRRESTTGFEAASEGDMEKLRSVAVEGTTTVADTLVDLVGKIRENIVLRRAALLSVPGGVVSSYIHNVSGPGLGSIGVCVGMRAVDKDGAVVALSPPTRKAVTDIAKKVAMHIAAAKPTYLNQAVVPPAIIQRERDIITAQAKGTGKTDAVIPKIVEGRLKKFYGDTVLLDQPFVMSEEGKKVASVVEEAGKAAGVKLQVTGFLHFVVGEAAASSGGAATEGATTA